MKQKAQRSTPDSDACKVTLGLPGASKCLTNHNHSSVPLVLSSIGVEAASSPRDGLDALNASAQPQIAAKPIVQARIQSKGQVMDLNRSITSRKQSGIDEATSINATTLMLDKNFNPLNEITREDENEKSQGDMTPTPNLYYNQSLQGSGEILAIKNYAVTQIMSLEDSTEKQKPQATHQMNQLSRSKTMLDRKTTTLTQSIGKTTEQGGISGNVLAPTMLPNDQFVLLSQKKSSLQNLNLPQQMLVARPDGAASQLMQHSGGLAQRIKSQVKPLPYRDSGASFSIASSIQPEALMKENTILEQSQTAQQIQKHTSKKAALTNKQACKTMNSKMFATHKHPNQDLHQFVPAKDKFDRNQKKKSIMSDLNKSNVLQKMEKFDQLTVHEVEEIGLNNCDAEDTQTQYGAKSNYDADLINARPFGGKKVTCIEGFNQQLLEGSIMGSDREPAISPNCAEDHSPSFASSKLAGSFIKKNKPGNSDLVKLIMPSMVLLKSKVVSTAETSIIGMVGAPPQTTSQLIEAKNKLNRPKKLHSQVRPNKSIAILRPESVKFSVQPRQNNLVTPDHPLFLNAMQKLQIYKRQMVSSSQPARGMSLLPSTSSASRFGAKRPVSQMNIQEGDSIAQTPNADQMTAVEDEALQVNSIETLGKDQASVFCSARGTEHLAQTGIELQQKLIPQNNMQSKVAELSSNYPLAGRRCSTSLAMSKRQQHDSTNRSLRSSLKEDSLQKSSTTKLPFHYRQMRQNVTLKHKLRTAATNNAVKRLAVRGAQACMQKQPFNKLLDNLSQKQNQLAIRHRSNKKKRMHTRGVGNGDETLTLLAPKTPTYSPKSSGRIGGSSVDILVHESNQNGSPHKGMRKQHLPNHHYHRGAMNGQHLSGQIDNMSHKLEEPTLPTSVVNDPQPLNIAMGRSADAKIKQQAPQQQHFQAIIQNVVPRNYQSSRTNNQDIEGSIQTMNQASEYTIHQIPMQVLSSKISEVESPERAAKGQLSSFFVQSQIAEADQQTATNIFLDNSTALGLLPNRTRSLCGTGDGQHQRSKTLTSLNKVNERAVTAQHVRKSIMTTASAQPAITGKDQKDEKAAPQVSININRQQSFEPITVQNQLSNQKQQEGVIQYENANAQALASQEMMKLFTDQDMISLQQQNNLQMQQFHQLQSLQNHQHQQQHVQLQQLMMKRTRPQSQMVYQSNMTGRHRRRQKDIEAKQQRLKQMLNKHTNSKAAHMLFGTVQADPNMVKKHCVLGGGTPELALSSILDGNLNLAEQLMFRTEHDMPISGGIANNTETLKPNKDNFKMRFVEPSPTTKGIRFRGDISEMNHQTATQGLKTSTMNYIMHDMKYKETLQGVPANREIKAISTKNGLKIQHHGSYSFASPQEIQYEIKKKLDKHQHSRTPYIQAARSRSSTQYLANRQYEPQGQQTLIVPGKRFTSTMPVCFEDTQATAKMGMFSSVKTPSTTQGKKIKESRVEVNENCNALSFCDEGFDGNFQNTLYEGNQELHGTASLQSPLLLNALHDAEKSMQQLQKSPTFEQQSHMIDAKETTVATYDEEPQRIGIRNQIIPGQRRSIELLPQQDQKYIEVHAGDENNTEGEDPQTRRILMSSLEEQAQQNSGDASTARLAKHDNTEQKPKSRVSISAVDSQAPLLARSIDVTHDGDSTEMRTMRHSSESLLFRDMMSVLPQNVVIEKTAAGSLSLNNSKLWQKQFGNSDTNSQNARGTSSKQHSIHAGHNRLVGAHHHRFHSDGVSKYMHMKQQNGGGQGPSYGQKSTLVTDILSQTLRLINQQIPVKPVLMQQKPMPKNRQRILRHRETQLQQRLLQNTQASKKEKVYNKPLSENYFLVPTKKTNNLSSYAHPKNAHIVEKEVTESIQL